MRIIALSILSGLFLGCSNPAKIGCNAVSDQDLKARILQAIRPQIEFFREFDGYHHTLEQELRFNNFSVVQCETTYEAIFTPKKLVDGFPTTGNAKTFLLDSLTLSMVDFNVEGTLKVQG